MDLSLTKRGDYAVRAALHLARASPEPGYAKIREVASAMRLPLSYTPQVLGLLARAGLAEAKAGRDGGYRLTRPPGDISLLEVVEAAERSLESTECTLRGGPCRWQEECAVHPTWIRASEAVRRALRATTLADLVEADRDLEGRGGGG